MDFKLNEYHRNISDDELLADVISVAKRLDKNSITIAEYDLNGKYNHTTISRRFGSWKNVLIMTNLRIENHNFSISNEDYLNDILRVATMLDKKSIYTTEYDKYGKFDTGKLIKRFHSWNNALLMAGLISTGINKNISDKDLFDEIERIWIELGRQPTTTDVKDGILKYSLNIYARRFGGWRNALFAFLEYINSDIEYAEKTVDTTDNLQISDNLQIDDNCTVNSIDKKIRKRKKPREINYKLRFKVLARDNFRCCACGASPAITPGVQLHIDHIKPWSKGGETEMDNLRTLCSKCNLGKGDLEL